MTVKVHANRFALDHFMNFLLQKTGFILIADHATSNACRTLLLPFY